MRKTSKSLQKAMDSLTIDDIYIKTSNCYCADGFYPKVLSNEIESGVLHVQQMHNVYKTEQLTHEGSTKSLLQIFAKFGVRWVESGKEDSQAVVAMIEADFIAEYVLVEKLEQKCIDEFALKNASFHVWPYWREYLSSQCERMRLPRVTLPTIQLNK